MYYATLTKGSTVSKQQQCLDRKSQSISNYSQSVLYLRKFSEHSVATALAKSVFPVPGAP